MVFSVIVPIYNVEKYIHTCIDSILDQSFKDFELILVDDGSPDDCPHICDEYAKKDVRVKVIHKNNGGLVSARNTGIKAATGDYICYVDGDDWIHCDLLKIMYEEAIVHFEPDMMVFGIAKKFNDHDEKIITDLADGIYEKQEMEKSIYPYMMYDNRKPFYKGLIFPVAWNKIYKKSLLLEHYCTDERIRMGEDNAFVYECVWYSEKIFICNEILYFYNQLNSVAMTHTYDEKRFENNQFLFDYMGSRIVGISDTLDAQFNAFKAYWLIMAVFHEVKMGRKINESVKHIRKEIQETKILDEISLDGLPWTAGCFLLFLKLRLYWPALTAAKIVNSFRKKG